MTYAYGYEEGRGVSPQTFCAMSSSALSLSAQPTAATAWTAVSSMNCLQAHLASVCTLCVCMHSLAAERHALQVHHCCTFELVVYTSIMCAAATTTVVLLPGGGMCGRHSCCGCCLCAAAVRRRMSWMTPCLPCCAKWTPTMTVSCRLRSLLGSCRWVRDGLAGIAGGRRSASS